MLSEHESQETQRARNHLWNQEEQEETEEVVRDRYGYQRMLRREHSDPHCLPPVAITPARSKKTFVIQEDKMEI